MIVRFMSLVVVFFFKEILRISKDLTPSFKAQPHPWHASKWAVLTMKRLLIGLISNIWYIKNKVQTQGRMYIAFYDNPVLEATQYYQRTSFFLSSDKDRRVLYPSNYYLMIYPLNTSRPLGTCTHLAWIRQQDLPQEWASKNSNKATKLWMLINQRDGNVTNQMLSCNEIHMWVRVKMFVVP